MASCPFATALYDEVAPQNSVESSVWLLEAPRRPVVTVR